MLPVKLKLPQSIVFQNKLRRLKFFNRIVDNKNFEVDEVNYLAIEILEYFNIYNPSEYLITQLETLIKELSNSQSLTQRNALESLLIKLEDRLRISFLHKQLESTCLSEGEIACLLMVAQGMKTEDIAKTLHLSKKTIEMYRYKIKKKLNMSSVYQVVWRYICTPTITSFQEFHNALELLI